MFSNDLPPRLQGSLARQQMDQVAYFGWALCTANVKPTRNFSQDGHTFYVGKQLCDEAITMR